MWSASLSTSIWKSTRRRAPSCISTTCSKRSITVPVSSNTRSSTRTSPAAPWFATTTYASISPVRMFSLRPLRTSTTSGSGPPSSCCVPLHPASPLTETILPAARMARRVYCDYSRKYDKNPFGLTDRQTRWGYTTERYCQHVLWSHVGDLYWRSGSLSASASWGNESLPPMRHA